MNAIKSNIVNYKNKKVKLFLIFLLLSFFFWFLSKLSKEYTTTVPFSIIYINQPKDKKIFPDENQKLEITLKSTGFDLLKYSFNKNIKVDLSVMKVLKKNKAIVDIKDILPQIQDQLGSQVSILGIHPELLEFDFGKLDSKKVKINPNLSLSYKSGYYLTEDLKIEPDSIVVSGPKEIIDTIHDISTKLLLLQDLKGNFKKEIPLIKHPDNKIKFNTNTVTIIGLVEKITEGEIELPIKIIHAKGVKIKVFNDKVTAKYKVSLKDYDKIKPEDFKVICDFSKTQKDSLNYLIPEIQKQSELVTDVELSPKRIEYLILK